MRYLLRIAFVLTILALALATASCRRGRSGGGLAGGIDPNAFRDAGGGDASCNTICNNLRRITAAEPDCGLELPPDCETACAEETPPPGVAECFARAETCSALVNCVDVGPDCRCDTTSACNSGCECDPDCDGPPPCACDIDSSCTEGCSCDVHCVPSFDAGTQDAGGPGVDAGGGGLCSNDCELAGNGDCDDGGDGAVSEFCEFGTDCFDCGPR
jgi:hypothetical protein